MASLERKREIIQQLLKDLSLNNFLENGTNSPGIHFDLNRTGLDLGINFPSFGGGNTTPTSIKALLLSLVNQSVEITTPAETFSGTLLAVLSDYIVLIDDGDQVLIPLENIELVSNL